MTVDREKSGQNPCANPEGGLGTDFSTLIISLSTTALLHLGEIPDPDGKAPRKNLDMARHTIDTMVMLEEKTRGNLTKDEEALLKRFLYDLRVRFVALCQGK